jgi:ABC-type multidrug transport system fused ATPase/permease subunit
MSRSRFTTCCSVGLILLIVTFVLQVLISVSLPFIPQLNVVNVKFTSHGGSNAANLPTVSDVSGDISQLRLGIWGYCGEIDSTGDNSCINAGSAYGVGVHRHDNEETANIHPSWTRGLVVHPIAAVATFIALIFALSHNLVMILIASLFCLFAALLTLIAFAIDIALFVLTKNSVGDLSNTDANTDFGPAFWLTLVSFILLLVSSVTTCVHRRIRQKRAGPTVVTESKRPFWRRWRRGGI